MADRKFFQKLQTDVAGLLSSGATPAQADAYIASRGSSPDALRLFAAETKRAETKGESPLISGVRSNVQGASQLMLKGLSAAPEALRTQVGALALGLNRGQNPFSGAIQQAARAGTQKAAADAVIESARQQQAFEAANVSGVYGNIANIAGQASSLPTGFIGRGAGALVKAAAPAARAARFLPGAANAFAQGAAQGAVASSESDRLSNALVGGVVGAGAGAALKGVGNVVSRTLEKYKGRVDLSTIPEDVRRFLGANATPGTVKALTDHIAADPALLKLDPVARVGQALEEVTGVKLTAAQKAGNVGQQKLVQDFAKATPEGSKPDLSEPARAARASQVAFTDTLASAAAAPALAGGTVEGISNKAVRRVRDGASTALADAKALYNAPAVQEAVLPIQPVDQLLQGLKATVDKTAPNLRPYAQQATDIIESAVRGERNSQTERVVDGVVAQTTAMRKAAAAIPDAGASRRMASVVAQVDEALDKLKNSAKYEPQYVQEAFDRVQTYADKASELADTPATVATAKRMQEFVDRFRQKTLDTLGEHPSLGDPAKTAALTDLNAAEKQIQGLISGAPAEQRATVAAAVASIQDRLKGLVRTAAPDGLDPVEAEALPLAQKALTEADAAFKAYAQRFKPLKPNNAGDVNAEGTAKLRVRNKLIAAVKDAADGGDIVRSMFGDNPKLDSPDFGRSMLALGRALPNGDAAPAELALASVFRKVADAGAASKTAPGEAMGRVFAEVFSKTGLRNLKLAGVTNAQVTQLRLLARTADLNRVVRDAKDGGDGKVAFRYSLMSFGRSVAAGAGAKFGVNGSGAIGALGAVAGLVVGRTILAAGARRMVDKALTGALPVARKTFSPAVKKQADNAVRTVGDLGGRIAARQSASE